MAGIQDVQPKQISSLGQPFVGPVENAVATPNVVALEEQIRKGNITAQELMERAQAAGARTAQNTAAQQQAKEFISPDQIQARQAQTQLAGAQASRAKATLDTDELVKKHFSYNGTPILGNDGNPDYHAMAESGANYLRAERNYQYATQGLTGTLQQYKDPTTGQPRARMVNAFGENITPMPDGSPNPILKRYQDARHDAFTMLNGEPQYSSNTPGAFARPPGEGETPPPSTVQAPAPIVVEPSAPAEKTFQDWSESLPPAPANPTPQEATSWMLNSKALTPAALLNMSNQDVLDSYSSFQGHLIKNPPPAGPATLPTASPRITIEPSSASPGAHSITVEPRAPGQSPVATPAPKPVVDVMGPSIITGPPESGFFGNPGEITKTAREAELYKNWAEKSATIGRFRATANAYTGKKGEITTQNDLDLASAALQMVMPSTGGGGRGMAEYKPRSLEETQPLIEQLYGIKAHVLKEHVFEKGTRDRIIAAAERTAQNLEAPARGVVQTASEQLKRIGQKPEDALFPHEIGLISQPATAGSPGPRGRLVTLSTGKQVYLK